MASPSAFTIHRSASRAVETWPIRDRRTEQLWLPIVGPTPYAVLLLVDRELEEAAEYFAPITLRVSDVADRLGVKVTRAFQALLRLERLELVARDPEMDRYEHPVFVVDRAVRAVGPADWPRLAASVRARYGAWSLEPEGDAGTRS